MGLLKNLLSTEGACETMRKNLRNLHEVVESTVELAASNASDKGLSLVCKIGAECRNTVGFDAWCVTQIITNLLSNALRYTKEGAVTVTATSQETSEGETYKITVADTGPGISETIQQAMFALPDQREALPGSDKIGFGLVISRQLCELFDGTLTISSTPDEGTIVTIEGPVNDKQLKDKDDGSLTDVFRNTYALIIDSDVAARRLLEAHLRSWGLFVKSVLDKDSALDLLAEQQRNGQHLSMLFASQDIAEDDLMTILKTVRSDTNATTMLVMTGSDITTGRMRVRTQNLGDATLMMPVKASELFDCIANHPFVAAQHQTPHEQPQSINSASNAPQILLVEDNIVNQCVASEILKRIGAEVTVANNGLEALSELDQHSFDFVFMDCQMPEMDGFEATRHIRTRPALMQLPVVALTANALSGDRQRCLDAGMSDYLTKPFTKTQLEEMLFKWLGSERMSNPLPNKKADSKEPQQSEISLVDEDALNEIRQLDSDGDTSIFDEIVSEYEASSNDLMARIESAVGTRDIGTVCRSAHALKSSSAALGLRHFGELCARLELLGQNNQPDSVVELWPTALDVYRKSLAALQSAATRKVA